MIKIEKANYILTLQYEGKTRHEIKDLLGYKNLDSMTKYMRKRGYKVDDDKYILNDAICHSDKNIGNTQLSINNDIGMTFGHQNNIKQDMIEIISHKEELLDILKWFKTRDDNSMSSVIEIINTGIKIDLPDSEIARTTIRINQAIWNEFDTFCIKNKEFNKQDLMAQALKEFMNKYNK